MINDTLHLEVDTVKHYLGIKGTASDKQISILIPSTVAFISKEINEELDVWQMPYDLAFVVSKFIEYFMNPVGVDSYSLSRESTTYSDNLPSYLMDLLKPYKKDLDSINQLKVFNLF